MKGIYRIIFLLSFISIPLLLSAQKSSIVSGVITDKNKRAVFNANISILGIAGGSTTDSLGRFSHTIEGDSTLKLIISHITFKTFSQDITPTGEAIESNISLEDNVEELLGVTIEDRVKRAGNTISVDPTLAKTMPSTTGGIEDLIQTLPGVSSNNEMSSQYSVRGGNFDENLVYVNDIQVYRPFLIRSGQQEGLSFINPDMVSSVQFSAGGFEAKYGDKLSSVLDITYRKPIKFSANASASLLGATVHLEDRSKNEKFTYQLGARQKSNAYLLNSLDTKGEYKPNFVDIQGFATYKFGKKYEINVLSNYSKNSYNIIPQTRESDFGTIDKVLRLTVYFDGREVDEFETYMSAISNIYKPNEYTTLKLIASGFRTFESETYDLLGQYWLDEVEADNTGGDVVRNTINLGVGGFLMHARNYLDATIYNASHKGYHIKDKHELTWGLTYQHELIKDKLSEWQYVDSSDYSLPISENEDFDIYESLHASAKLETNRYSAFIQNTNNFGKNDQYFLNYGTRFNYWDYSKQSLISPRASFAIQPDWEKDFMFRLAAGVYYQPPFYRELRDRYGILNKDIKAQQSIHFVAGSDYNFRAWSRPFKFVSEIYFKKFDDLIPYEINNVRIRYYADNMAKGYATGVDLRINGEFVKGVESWASLSVMKTEEDLRNDFYYEYLNNSGEKISYSTEDQTITDSVKIEPGAIPRLTDERVHMSIVFQDYLPRWPKFKMQLKMVFGSGLPFGPPSFDRYRDTLRIRPYRRVDIGFSYTLLEEDRVKKEKGFGRHLKSIWFSAEVFNLLQIDNVVSYIWVKDVTGNQYAVPNSLTARLINLKLIVRI
ncbi:MAG: TonB-dependent receptor [Flavobacteriales bacterium]|nr:TonB-dependent receptor [Flavobacteriales bacterium]